MKKWLLILNLFLVLLFAVEIHASEDDLFSSKPTKMEQKRRIGYYQGGSYTDYLAVFKAVIKALMEMSWIESKELPDIQDANNIKDLWLWLAKEVSSDSIEFVEDAFYDSNWDNVTREKIKTDAIARLKSHELDLMLAFGTWAGQDLSNNEHSVPTMVLSTSDPVSAKIIKSIEDSGYDHIHARVDPNRYARQLQIFYNLFSFKRLGLVYEDTVEGRSYAAVNIVEILAKGNGFKVIPCHAQFSKITEAEAQENIYKCHQKLAPEIDALYITTHRGISKTNISDLITPLMAYKIPTFSQIGTEHVKSGVLLSMAEYQFLYVGHFYAETIAKILNGAKPRALSQIFKSPPQIAINLETAKMIGYEPPIDVLGAADEIYEVIIPSSPQSPLIEMINAWKD
ncbi:ABC transporter substrate binding protein [Deltaproteobacteria bacterium TL4]